MLNFPKPTLKCILGLLTQFNGLTSLIKGRHILPRQSLWHVMPIQFQSDWTSNHQNWINREAIWILRAHYTFSNGQTFVIMEKIQCLTHREMQFFHTHPPFHTLDIMCEGFTALRQTYNIKYLGSEFHVTKTPKVHFYFTIPLDLIYLTLSFVHRSALKIFKSALMGENVLHVDF